MSTTFSLQDVLQVLTQYWTERGCMIAQPFNTEVGAGTGNPATALRVLGPEPWRVAYVEPSVRPDDSRYGENPNRLQTHTQFQVILKPDPGNPQELYLGSLAAIGIDLAAHDVRFVEDNWASPALGAWGLGWEVWLDGMEITQFTYFQQMGGLEVAPVAVEITYGIERIMMALQGVTNFKQIEYAPGISYGEVFGQAEYEMSRYYLDEADIETTRVLFDQYAAEADRMIEQRLPLPAYYCVLKCSHTFNILDSRGAVSTTERARAFTRMRRLSHSVSELWVERRTELGFPLGAADQAAVAARPTPEGAPSESAQTLLLEIGCEELPAGEVERARLWLADQVAAQLDATQLAHGSVRAYATPRRLVAIIDAVAPREADTTETVRGPRVSAAFDATGAPSKAALGFAGKQGVAVEALERIEVGGAEHVAVRREVPGRPAAEVIDAVVSAVVRGLRADRNMRWSDPELTYSRPLRWLVCLLGTQVVPVVVGALASGRQTRVLRVAAQPEVSVPAADGYLDFLRGHQILADPAERRSLITAAAAELASEVGGQIELDREAGLVDEIIDLVEAPVPIRGDIDPRHLELPEQVLTTVMRKHQRYLPVRSADGTLAAHFVTFANGDCDLATVKAGNESVVRARFEDAAFFYAEDRKSTPEQLKAGLTKLAFEEHLGSMAQRADRIEAVARRLAADANELSDSDQQTLNRAARLAKFDLASSMVVEMTSLAGTMAYEYARAAGEDEAVALALADMERPRSTDDAVATTVPGAVLALADRADLLVGMFAVGANPTGSSDPFGLRRAALGLVQTLRGFPALRAITVSTALDAAAEVIRAQGVEVDADVLDQAQAFVRARFEQAVLDEGQPRRLVESALVFADQPARLDETVAELVELAGDTRFAALVAAMGRIRRINKGDFPPPTDRALLSDPAELRLAAAVDQARADRPEPPTLRGLLAVSGELVTAIEEFMTEVLVLADDPALRAARLGVLGEAYDLGDGLVDWLALS